MALTLYDTLSREQRTLQPLDGKTLRFYCCGPTVYGPAHIGNFRTFAIQDVLRRVIEAGGTPTLHVRNLTDVDDKTIRDSQRAGQSLSEFTAHWTRRFHEDCLALNLLAPHHEPNAVAHIDHQVRMIETLMQRGHAYAGTDGSVYFRVGSYSQYGRLSHLDERELKTGGSSQAQQSDEYSKDSLADFALWKARRPEDGDNFWPSPWGEGRPGWHLECSAMALEYLGEDFDLHSGGIDLIFPHHENEIAQSCCSTQGRFANHWFHVAHLMVDGGKMSKSLGNLYTLEDLAQRGFSAAEVRYCLISGHYHTPLNFTMHSLQSAAAALQKLAKFRASLLGLVDPASPPQCKGAGPFASAWQLLENDLNVPAALGAIFALINDSKPSQLDATRAAGLLSGLDFMTQALGLRLPEPGAAQPEGQAPAEILELAQQRWEAKQARDWPKADALRVELESKGWVIKDGKGSFEVHRK